jgi:hypothetical protein
LRTFSLSIPTDAPEERQFHLRFRLTGGAWKLAAVGLPEQLRIRLAQQRIRAVDKK